MVAIIAVGYNRPDSMKQLLHSILCAEYGEDRIDLVISIDKSERQQELVAIAENINWIHGEKIIRAFPERQGLRAHIIQCGDLTKKYDAVVVLEDDLIVAPYFYSYVRQAITRYKNDSRIAGVSLYRHQLHQGVNRPFEPSNNGYDVYLHQYAASWGQCWTKEMWKGFRLWYSENENKDLASGNILPAFISRWNKQSWLKYYMRYIVETDKYFVYPYYALSTNSSEAGEHSRLSNNDYQVPLQEGDLEYRFPTVEQAVKYDVYFERLGIDDRIYPDLNGTKLLDLYGNRNNYRDARYLISTKELPYKVVRKNQLRYRPIEANVLKPVDGEGIFVYDLTKEATAPTISGLILTRYDVRTIHWKRTLQHGWNGFVNAVLSRTPFRKH